jgi:sulfoxide reductase heme-binding subunit YedZ
VKTGVRTPWKVTAVLTVLLLVRLAYSIRKRATAMKTPAVGDA